MSRQVAARTQQRAEAIDASVVGSSVRAIGQRAQVPSASPAINRRVARLASHVSPRGPWDACWLRFGRYVGPKWPCGRRKTAERPAHASHVRPDGCRSRSLSTKVCEGVTVM